MNNLEQIPQFMQAYRNCRLRVGFSGGADSTALLLLLLAWSWSPEALEAVHFDHGLRGEASKLDAVWCRQFCAELNVPFKLVELHLDECIDNKQFVSGGKYIRITSAFLLAIWSKNPGS